MKQEEDIEKVLQNSSHGKPKWYVIFNGPFRGIYTYWVTASTHIIEKSVSHKIYLTKEAAEKALEESYKTIATEETPKSKQFVSPNQHLQSQTAKLNAFNIMKNISTAKEKEEMRRPEEQKLLVPLITVAQLGVSNKGYPDKDEKIECAPPMIDDLVYSFIEVLVGSSKIGMGSRQKDKIKISYCSKNLLMYSKFQERIDEVQLKVLSDFEEQIELFLGLLAPLPEDLKHQLCSYMTRNTRHHCYYCLEDPEEEPKEDVDIKLEDDAELIFPYEVEDDKTPPPGDVSSDSVSSKSESEDEEVNVAPEATAGTTTEKPYVIRDFSRGLFEVGESFSARDSSNVNGLAPCALRHDLEASRARARVMEAELGTCQTEIALLKSKDKIREKERELLNHDLENVKHALGNVLKRILVLESRENATLKKRLAETETKLVWARMERETTERRIMPLNAMSEARMREIIRDQVTTSMAEFVANMNRGTGGAGVGGTGVGGTRADGARADGAEVGGARLAAPEITGCTYITFMKCEPRPFKGTEGAVGLRQWFEKLESMFRISDCKERDNVKFITSTLKGRGLTWWNGRIASMCIDDANGTSWTEVRKWMTEEFYPRSVLQRLEQELYNLKLKWTDIDGYTNRFHELALLCPSMVEPEQVKVEQYIHGLSKNICGDVTSSRPTGEKRKGEGDRGGCGDNRRDYNRRRDCPKLKKNGQGGNNRGAVYKLRAMDAQQDPKVVT
nr:hypothetical protein [Tanacetum cinerariifolium]